MVPADTRRIRVVLGALMIGVLTYHMVIEVHRVMVRLEPCHCDGTLTNLTRRRARHGGRDRTPNGEQDGKQDQQPNMNGSHSEIRLTQRRKPQVLEE